MDVPWAQTGKPANWDPTELLPLLAVTAGVVLVGVVVIVLVDRWRKRPTAPDNPLSHFQALYDRGELSREEFERVRGLLLGKHLGKDLGPSKPSPAPEGIQTRVPPRREAPAPDNGIRRRPPDQPPPDNPAG